MIIKRRPEEYDVNDELKVTSYKFELFSKSPDDKVKNYKYIHLDQAYEELNKDKLQKSIRSERGMAHESGFTVEPIVSEFRGMKRQAELDHEQFVRQSVEQELERIKDGVIMQAFEEGEKRAYTEAKERIMLQSKEILDDFKLVLQEIEAAKREILDVQKEQIYQLIKMITKWAILREISDDGQYIRRLLEKLILELGVRDNLLIKVNRQAFKTMPELLQIVQEGFGELKNVRVEVDLDAERPGIVLESLNTIIDGSFEVQLQQLDKLFSSMKENE